MTIEAPKKPVTVTVIVEGSERPLTIQVNVGSGKSETEKISIELPDDIVDYEDLPDGHTHAVTRREREEKREREEQNILDQIAKNRMGGD